MKMLHKTAKKRYKIANISFKAVQNYFPLFLAIHPCLALVSLRTVRNHGKEITHLSIQNILKQPVNARMIRLYLSDLAADGRKCQGL